MLLRFHCIIVHKQQEKNLSNFLVRNISLRGIHIPTAEMRGQIADFTNKLYLLVKTKIILNPELCLCTISTLICTATRVCGSHTLAQYYRRGRTRACLCFCLHITGVHNTEIGYVKQATSCQLFQILKL